MRCFLSCQPPTPPCFAHGSALLRWRVTPLVLAHLVALTGTIHTRPPGVDTIHFELSAVDTAALCAW